MALVDCRSLRNASTCVLISMALIGVAQAFPFQKSDKKAQKVSMQEKTHEQVVGMLQSRDRQLATQAVHEIMKRGEPMILFLMHVKGDTRLFEGEELGDIRSSRVVPLQAVKNKISQESIVTNEVAAIYLINAIYYGNRLFASPWLADATLPRKERLPQNSSHLIAKAWEAVENWINELKKENLDSLRAKKFDPLKNSGVTFFD